MLSVCKIRHWSYVGIDAFFPVQASQRSHFLILDGLIASYTFIVMGSKVCFDLQRTKCLGLFR